MRIDRDNLIVEFQEKPPHPTPMPNDPRQCLASMEVYVFRKDLLLEQLLNHGGRRNPRLDFGHHVLPRIIQQRQANAYPFLDSASGQTAYWRDVGTVDAYYQASRDLLTDKSLIRRSDLSWRIHSHVVSTVPAFMDFSNSGGANLHCSLVGPGTRVTDAFVSRSILSSEVNVREGAEVVDSILFDGVRVGPGTCLRNTIVDKNVEIPRGVKIGFDAEWDRGLGFHVTAAGVVVVPKGYVFSWGRRGERVRADGVQRTPLESPSV